jgi:hypothetical protein
MSSEHLDNAKNEDGNAKPAFKNSIIKEGQCGNFGKIDFLKNSDPFNSYTVTVEEHSYGGHGAPATTQRPVQIAAGGKENLGCDKLAGFGSPSVQRTVVGEQKH